MQFPYYFYLFGLRLHPHVVMEALGYTVALTTHFAIKSRTQSASTAPAEHLERNLWHVAAAALGALIGAKLLAWIENWHALTSASPKLPPGLERWIGGKTIVGGLVGGWIGVEIAKRLLGGPNMRQRTGDPWVYPLIVSIAIGRIGCFLTGLADQTYGNPTTLPWAVDFGDGIPRHPTQFYEIAFLLLLGVALLLYQHTTRLGFATGKLFRLFMLAYSLWRFFIEFIKPTDKPFLGASAIQIVSLLTALFCIWSLVRIKSVPLTPLVRNPTPR